jgi:transcriptional regulator with XRE-family HTH domain
MTGAELKQSREDLKLTQEQLAEVLGIEVTELIEWEASEVAGGKHEMILNLAINCLEMEAEFESDRMKDLYARLDENRGRAEESSLIVS